MAATVTGLDEAKLFILSLPSEVALAGDDIVEEVAARVEAKALYYVPIRTGALLHSIKTESPVYGVRTVGSKLAYAGYVEYGTSRMRERPYLRPAWESVQAQLDSIIIGVLMDHLAKYA
ncbi:MAG: HK97-gp10 family putative phage morphogenesis protein [Candidatus Bathyarchaeia archaeon]